MNARRWLYAYLMAVVAISYLHEPLWLAVVLAVALMASGCARWQLLRRALLAVAAFSFSVSIAYLLLAIWRGDFSARYLLLVNLRVVLLVYLGFWFIQRVRLSEALAFSPSLSFLSTLVIGQIGVFSRIVRDFRLAFVSRNPTVARPVDHVRHAFSQAACLLDKSISSADETALAMRSRGCFDD